MSLEEKIKEVAEKLEIGVDSLVKHMHQALDHILGLPEVDLAEVKEVIASSEKNIEAKSEDAIKGL